MAMQTRVPGAASSEVDFELERFERTAEDRIEISGRWYGLRGRRFVRPVLNLNSGGSRRRAIALLEHKPWAAEDGQVWLAAFRWPEGAGEVSGAELEVGPGLLVDLPAMGGKAGAASVRVTALRPHVPAVPPWRGEEGDEGEGGPGEPRGRAAGDPSGRGRSAADPSGRGRPAADPSGRGRPAADPSDRGRPVADPSGRGRPAADPTGGGRASELDPAGRRSSSRRAADPAGRDSSYRRTAGISARAAAPAWTDAPQSRAAFDQRG